MPSPRALFGSPTHCGRTPGRRLDRDPVDAYPAIIDAHAPARYAECYLAGAVPTELQSSGSSARSAASPPTVTTSSTAGRAGPGPSWTPSGSGGSATPAPGRRPYLTGRHIVAG
jgi:hypothetical protein